MRTLHFHREGKGKISRKYDVIFFSSPTQQEAVGGGPSKYLVETESCILLLISKDVCTRAHQLAFELCMHPVIFLEIPDMQLLCCDQSHSDNRPLFGRENVLPVPNSALLLRPAVERGKQRLCLAFREQSLLTDIGGAGIADSSKDKLTSLNPIQVQSFHCCNGGSCQTLLWQDWLYFSWVTHKTSIMYYEAGFWYSKLRFLRDTISALPQTYLQCGGRIVTVLASRYLGQPHCLRQDHT